MKKLSFILISGAVLLSSCGPTAKQDSETNQQLLQKSIDSLNKVLDYFYKPQISDTNNRARAKRLISSDSEIFTPQYKMSEYDESTTSYMAIPLTYMELFKEVISDSHYIYSNKPKDLNFGIVEGIGTEIRSYTTYNNDVFACDMQLLDVNMYISTDIVLSSGQLSRFDVYGKDIGGSSDGSSSSIYMHFETGNLYVYNIAKYPNGSIKLTKEYGENDDDVANYCFNKIIEKQSTFTNKCNELGSEKINYIFSDAFNKAAEWEENFIGYASEGNMPVSDCVEISKEDFEKEIIKTKSNDWEYAYQLMDSSNGRYLKHISLKRSGDVVRIDEEINRNIDRNGEQFSDVYIDHTYFAKEDNKIYKYKGQFYSDETDAMIYFKTEDSHKDLNELNLIDLSSFKFSDFIFDVGTYKTTKPITINGVTYNNGFYLAFKDAKLTEMGTEGGAVQVIFNTNQEEIVLPTPMDENCLVSDEEINQIGRSFQDGFAYNVRKIGDENNYIRIYSNSFHIFVSGERYLGEGVDHAYLIGSPELPEVICMYLFDSNDQLIEKKYSNSNEGGLNITDYLQMVDEYLFGYPEQVVTFNSDMMRLDPEKGCYSNADFNYFFKNKQIEKIVRPERNIEFFGFSTNDDFPNEYKYEFPKTHTKDEYDALVKYPEAPFQIMASYGGGEYDLFMFDGSILKHSFCKNNVYDTEFYVIEDGQMYVIKKDDFSIYHKYEDTIHSTFEEMYQVFDFSLVEYEKVSNDSFESPIYHTQTGSYTMHGITCAYLLISLENPNELGIYGRNNDDMLVIEFTFSEYTEQIELPELA